jgi:N-acetylglucosamine kinase-like BadF-type ATPase
VFDTIVLKDDVRMSNSTNPTNAINSKNSTTPTTLVFGADGGGTKTLGVVADLSGRERARRTVGASNPNVVGFETAASNLFQLITECCEAANCSPIELRSLVFGLAGAGREENRAKLRSMVCSLAGLELPITMETDARIGLEGAFGGGPGVVIIAGTGSVVIGKKDSEELVTVGGWGRGFGDEGSGFFLGMEALKSLRLYYDGRGGSPLLAEMLAKEFGLNSRERIIAAVHQEKFEPSLVAPLVLAAAEKNDAVALRILNAGASELVEQARVLVGRLNVAGTVGIVFVGGAIANDTIYRKILKEKIERNISNASVQSPLHEPVYGAVLMALALCKRR